MIFDKRDDITRKKIKLSIIIAILFFITLSIITFQIESRIFRSILLFLYLIPSIIITFSFGFKGSVIITVTAIFIHSPDYVLFIGQLDKDILDTFSLLLIFISIALTFGFFIEKWNIEKRKLDQLNENLNKMNIELKEMIVLKEVLEKQERLASLGIVSSGIAHELKNPLSIIKTTVSSLSKDIMNNPEIKEAKSVIDEEINRANSVINSVLSIAKDSDLFIKSFNIVNLIKGILRLLKNNFIKNRIDVIFDYDEIKNIDGDEQKLSRVFFNVIINAIDSLEEMGGGWIKININQDNINTFIKISDSGGGIKQSENLFTPFFTTKEKGTGLGLSISKKIIDEHNGDINFNNTKEGALFTIILPNEFKGVKY